MKLYFLRINMLLLSFSLSITAVAQLSMPITKKGPPTREQLEKLPLNDSILKASQKKTSYEAEVKYVDGFKAKPKIQQLSLGGINGGGGNVGHGVQGMLPYLVTDRRSGLLIFLLRLENFAAAPGDAEGAWKKDYFRKLYHLSGGLFEYPNSVDSAYSALQTMFYSSSELNPVTAIKHGRIRINVSKTACIHNGVAKDGSAKNDLLQDGNSKIGAGEICISASRLEQLSPRDLNADLFPLILHELGHLYGLNEESALALQWIARARVEHLINLSWEYQGSVIQSTDGIIQKNRSTVGVIRSGLERFKKDIATGNLDSGEIREVSAIVYQNVSRAMSSLLEIQKLWEKNSVLAPEEPSQEDFFLPIPKSLRTVRNELIEWDKGAAEYHHTIWFPMNPQNLGDYEDFVSKIEKTFKELDAAADRYIKSYEIRAYGE
jgi:hypothetical protein